MLGTMLLQPQRLPGTFATPRTHGMGMTTIRGMVRHPDGTGRRRRITFLIDTGAVYSVLPHRIWRALGLVPSRCAEFALADGSLVSRGVSEARFTIAGITATSPVVCGEGNDSALLGAVTLETLGLMVNPLSREVLPMRLVLGSMHP